MEYVVKKFSSLTIDELYEILKLRVDVFVVEQKCPYPEIDDRDQEAFHVYIKDEDGIIAYCRVLGPHTNLKETSIGRVIAKKRRMGLGTKIVEEGVKVAQSQFKAETIQLEAQVYAKGLYEKVGFQQISEPFLEDGIPHILMERSEKLDDR